MKTKTFVDIDGDSLEVRGCSIGGEDVHLIVQEKDQTCEVAFTLDQIPALCEALLKAARKAKG